MSGEGEKALLQVHPSRLYSAGYYAVAWFFLALAIGALANVSIRGLSVPDVQLGPFALERWLTYVFGALGVLFILAAEIRRIAKTFIITESRVVRKEGILRRKVNMVPYRQVERVELNQGILQRIFRVGTVHVDTGEELLLIEHVAKPANIQDMIHQRVGLSR